MSTVQFALPYRPAWDSNGKMIPGAQLYFTLTGTNTPVTVYADSGLTEPLPNPVIANAAGRFPVIHYDDTVGMRARLYEEDATVGIDTPLEEYNPYLGFATTSTVDAVARTDAATALTAANDASDDAADAIVAAAAATAAVAAKADTSAVTTALALKADEASLNDRSLSPLDYGAVGNDTSNDATAVLACLNAAMASGRPVDGGEKIYAVSGTMALTGGTSLTLNIKRLRLRQITPNAVNRRTVHIYGGVRLVTESIIIDKGTLGSAGAIADAAALWVSDGKGHRINGFECFGASKGQGLVLVDATDAIVAQPYVHDMSFDESGATDDRLQGIWFERCTDCKIVAPNIQDLTGNAPAHVNRFTRGIAFGSCTDCQILLPTVSGCDQGIDISSSSHNTRCQVVGGNVIDCASWGVKMANSAIYCKANGVTAIRCGLSGFVASGPGNGFTTAPTQHCEFNDCLAIDCGGSAWGSAIGFLVLDGGGTGAGAYAGVAGSSWPRGITFKDCKAIDSRTTKVMTRGFWNRVTFTAGSFANQMIDCESIGHTTEAQLGFHRPFARVTGTGNQSMTNSVAAPITWDVETEDSMGWHSTSSNTSRVVVDKPGWYRAKGHLRFAANGTGYRSASVYIGGSYAGGGGINAINGTVTVVPFDVEVQMSASAYAEVYGDQNSGGPLDVDRANSAFSLEFLRYV